MDSFAVSGIWAGAIVTIMTLTFLYKETRLFRIVEHMIVGLGAGYFVVWGVKNVSDIAVTGLQRGQYSYLVPILLGIVFYTRLSSRYGWPARWSIAVIVGVSTGLFMRGVIDVQFIGQIIATGSSIITKNIFDGVNNLLGAIITICTITYFIYTREQKGFLGHTSRIGRYAMMISFGAIFGGTVVSRMSTMLGVLQFLLFDWLGIR